MPSEAHIKNFLFCKKVMFCSQDIQVLVFLTIPWFTKSVISWWVLVHVTVHLIYLLNYNSLKQQTWSIGRYKQGQYISEIFWMIWRTGAKFKTFSNLVTCFNYSINNHVKFPLFHFFQRMNKGELKMVNINY